MTSSEPDVCHCALLTPRGISALAVIGIRGERAERVLRSLVRTRRKTDLDHVVPGEIHVVDFRHADSTFEESVLIRHERCLWELQCHGGALAPQSMLESLAKRGAKILAWEDWLCLEFPQALLHDARVQLAPATHLRPTTILLDQLRGAMPRELESFLQRLRSDESSADLTTSFERLLSRASVGRRLLQGHHLALVGPPNAGKSSLMNAIVGYQRSIVHEEPGTTRDVLTAASGIEGFPVTFHDTAGLREGMDAVEREGVVRAIHSAEEADLVLVVTDRSAPFPAEKRWLDEIDRIAVRKPLLYVHNKSDLTRHPGHRPAGCEVSALRDLGVEDLLRNVAEMLFRPAIGPGDAVPITAWQVEALERICESLRSGNRAAAIEQVNAMLTRPSRTGETVSS